MVDITKKLWTLVRHGRDQGMKMDVVEEAARALEARPRVRRIIPKPDQDKDAVNAILCHWRNRFPSNAYAWPAVPESFALEAVRALKECGIIQQAGTK